MRRTRRFRYFGETLYRWLPAPAWLPQYVEYRWLITGKSGHPRSPLFRGTFCTTCFNPFIPLARAPIAKAEPIGSRMSRIYTFRVWCFSEFVLPRRASHGSMNGVSEGKPYIYDGYWIIPPIRRNVCAIWGALAWKMRFDAAEKIKRIDPDAFRRFLYRLRITLSRDFWRREETRYRDVPCRFARFHDPRFARCTFNFSNFIRTAFISYIMFFHFVVLISICHNGYSACIRFFEFAQISYS